MADQCRAWWLGAAVRSPPRERCGAPRGRGGRCRLRRRRSAAVTRRCVYVLEVNGIPGWQGLQQATGLDVAPLSSRTSSERVRGTAPNVQRSLCRHERRHIASLPRHSWQWIEITARRSRCRRAAGVSPGGQRPEAGQRVAGESFSGCALRRFSGERRRDRCAARRGR